MCGAADVLIVPFFSAEKQNPVMPRFVIFLLAVAVAFCNKASAFVGRPLCSFTNLQRVSVGATFLQASILDRLLTEQDYVILEELDRRVNDFDDLVTQAIVTKSQQVIDEVAVAVVKMLVGDWDLQILTTTNASTSEDMESTVAEMSQLSTALGFNLTSEQLKESRLGFKSAVDVTQYPPRLLTDISLSGKQVVKFYGQLYFDVLLKTVAYKLDELTVLGVAVDLNSTIMKEAAAEAIQEQESAVAEQEPSEEKSLSLWGRIKSFWKKVFQRGGSKEETTPAQAELVTPVDDDDSSFDNTPTKEVSDGSVA